MQERAANRLRGHGRLTFETSLDNPLRDYQWTDRAVTAHHVDSDAAPKVQQLLQMQVKKVFVHAEDICALAWTCMPGVCA
jgi:hypothetical protein